jgi:hypothetical protein
MWPERKSLCRGGVIHKALKSIAFVLVSVPLLGAGPQRCGHTAGTRPEKPAALSTPSAAEGAAKRLSRLAEGTWGGRGAVLRVTAEGAEAEFDCAHGAIKGRIELDARGSFDVAGTFVPEGGPVRVPAEGAAEEKGFKARYRGRVEGKKLTLDVTIAETGGGTDELTLTHGQEPRLEKCY